MKPFHRVQILPVMLVAAQAACAVEATSTEAELASSGIAPRASSSHVALSGAGADLQVSWYFNGEHVSHCGDFAATTAEVVLQPSRGAAFAESFPCQGGTARILDLPLDTYAVYVNLLAADGRAVGQSSFSETVYARVPGQLVTVPAFDVHGGQFELSWTVRDRRGRIACSAVGADSISVLSTPVGPSGTGYDDVFHDCDAGYGRTSEMPFGAYTVVVSLLDPAERAIGAAPAQSAALAAPATHGLVDLGNFDFTF